MQNGQKAKSIFIIYNAHIRRLRLHPGWDARPALMGRAAHAVESEAKKRDAPPPPQRPTLPVGATHVGTTHVGTTHITAVPGTPAASVEPPSARPAGV
jgi:hypothetical protein